MEQECRQMLQKLHQQLQVWKRKMKLRGEQTHWAGVKVLMEEGGACSAEEVNKYLALMQIVCGCHKSRKVLCEQGNVEFIRSGVERQILVRSSSQVTSSMIAKILDKLSPHSLQHSTEMPPNILPPVSEPMIGISNDDTNAHPEPLQHQPLQLLQQPDELEIQVAPALHPAFPLHHAPHLPAPPMDMQHEQLQFHAEPEPAQFIAAKLDRRFWRVTNKLTEIFKQFRIDRCTYHNNTLTGRDCVRFTQKWDLIRPQVQELFTGPLRRPNVCEDFAARVDHFLHTVSRACKALVVTHFYLYKCEPLSPQEADNFDKAGEYLGMLQRTEDCLGHHVTVKLHLLETHAPSQMREFGQLGQFLEEAIEREHKDGAILNARFNRFPDWASKQRPIMNTLNNMSNPIVNEYAETVRLGTARTFTDDTRHNRAVEEALQQDELEQKVEEIMVTIRQELQQYHATQAMA